MSAPTTHSHGHDHGHSHAHAGAHSHSHSPSFTETNKAFFDDASQTYHERPRARELARRQTAAMRAAYPDLFDEDRTVLMDYACGTGLISQELCAYVHRVVGVDISQGMVDQYNLHASNQGLAPDEMRAVCTELTGAPEELEGTRFDVIVCASAYHHFPSIDATTRVLASFLAPGGALLVADVMRDAGGAELFPADYGHVVPHRHGLGEDEVRRAFEGAELGAFELRELFTATHGASQREVRMFLARGVKPREA